MITDKCFIDWEQEYFGYGYGSGEPWTLGALKQFMLLINKERLTYDYTVLEDNLGSTVAWLMINILCNAGILEFGLSARYGWLSEKGKLLYKYLENKTVEELCDVVNVLFQEHIYCGMNYCNCKGGFEDRKCINNPLF